MELKLNTQQNTSYKKLHPSWIGFDLFKSIKGFILFCLFITVFFGYSSTSILSIRGFVVLGIFIVYRVVSTLLEWRHFNYYINNEELYIEKGRLVTVKRHFPLDKIQGIQQSISFFHRLTGLTAISIDVGSSEKNAAIKLEVITLQEAEAIKKILAHSTKMQVDDVQPYIEKTESSEKPLIKTHYMVDPKEILIASLTSFSLLFFVFLLYSAYSEINQYFSLENYVDKIFGFFQSSIIMLTLGITLLIVLSLVAGFLKTYVQYGGFKVTSDTRRIYIEKGLADKTYFSIPKDKVQALSISSGFIHKFLDIATVKLISSIDTDDETMKASNVLFPFIKRTKANSLIPEVLPSFEVSKTLTNIPKISIIVKILRTFYGWLLIPAAIYYFFPSSWYIAVLLSVLVFSSQIFNGIFSGYKLNGSFLQFKKGAIITRTFIMKQNKIERLRLSETFIQKRSGLASLKITIRSMPTREIVVHDVPVEVAYLCQSWFIETKDKIAS